MTFESLHRPKIELSVSEHWKKLVQFHAEGLNAENSKDDI